MKFTDGPWCKPAGQDFRGGVEVVDILNDGKKNGELEYLVATKHIASRGDTLNGTLLTVNISSPCDDIIKIR